MGAVEAFVIGGVAGSVGALVVYVVWGSTAKGRSQSAFHVPGWSSVQVLQTAQAHLLQNGMRVRPSGDGIVGEEGSEWATGVRVLEVRVRDREGGADVWIDAFIRGFYPKEISLDPSAFFGMVPRRKGLRLAQGLAASLGAPGAVWQHRRG